MYRFHTLTTAATAVAFVMGLVGMANAVDL